MSDPVKVPRGSVEYVKAVVRADVTLDATVGVAISLSTGSPQDGYTHAWLTAEWTGAESTTRTARTSSAVTFSTRASYTVFVKLTDSPEIPYINAGLLQVGA